jgi:hypothetical protein
MTSLMTAPCGESCSNDAVFKISFIINSMTLIDEKYYGTVSKVLTITWDKRIIREIFHHSIDGWRHDFEVFCPPQQLSEKFKSCPIMINISTIENESFGSLELPLNDCFCDAVLSKQFQSEDMHTDFTFYGGGGGTMDIDLRVARGETNKSAFEALEKSSKAKDLQTQSTDSSSDEDDDLDFNASPDELTKDCKKNEIELGQNFYRIINGHLINVKEKKGFCGDVCATAKKYCKELKEVGAEQSPSGIDVQKLFMEHAKDVRVDCTTERIERIREAMKMFERSSEVYEHPMKTKKKVTKTKRRTRRPNVCAPTTSQQPQIDMVKLNKIIEEKKKVLFGKYSYDYGNAYPFHRRGCTLQRSESVPSNMGWRHDKIHFPNKSWYPGRIDETVRILMKHHLSPYPYDTIALSNANDKMKMDGSSCNDDNELKSTLRVTKRNGEISIEMHPMKEAKELATDCTPFLGCEPIKFIIKRRPEEIKKHNARVLLKAREVERKCKCVDIKRCHCISQIEKRFIQEEMTSVSKELELKKELMYEEVYDSSDSDMDFSFSPPVVHAAVEKCKADVIHAETQYEIKHFTNREVKIYVKNATISKRLK